MTTLSSARLLGLLLAATGATAEPSDNAPKPALLDIPNLGRIRVYLWTTTPDQSAPGHRPAGEHKSQIILPNTPRGSIQVLIIDNIPTFLLGFSPLFGVFVAWEARRHQQSAYSKNIQVKERLLADATESGWAIDEPRQTNAGSEVRAAIHPTHLVRFLRASIMADQKNLEGESRQNFLLSHAPDIDALGYGAKADNDQPEDIQEVQRARIAAGMTRLARDRSFAERILAQYEHQCAVCLTQLTIIDGAHIIPVHDARGTDDDWNGLALCKNHHALFDKRILLIDADAIVRVDGSTRAFLESVGKIGGYDVFVAPFVDRVLNKLPIFFDINHEMTKNMKDALLYNYKLTS